ncbi:MAG: ATP-binding cassette domain-containing protein [Candidatus Micrarchaeia archaeon]
MTNEELDVECAGLTKKFGSFTAVNSLELKIKKGELFGFLGPNGAGKTTTIKMLTTLLAPNGGKAKIAGYDLVRDAAIVRSKIGVVPQEFALFGELTPMENLWYIGELFGMNKSEIIKRSEELLKTVGLYEKKDIYSEGFSGGMKQRLSVAAGLLHKPQILFMDEPTTGLDPQSRIALRELTKRLNDSGMTIVYTTHDMEEADKLCQRIAIMDKGHIIAEGTPQELKRKHGGNHRIEIETDEPAHKLAEEIKEFLKIDTITVKGNKIEISMKNMEKAALLTLSNYLAKKHVKVKELRTAEPSLEDVFINLTKKDVRD